MTTVLCMFLPPSLCPVQGGLSSDPLILEGSGVAGARFGMSVLNLGNIDQDDFEGEYMYM